MGKKSWNRSSVWNSCRRTKQRNLEERRETSDLRKIGKKKFEEVGGYQPLENLFVRK